MHPRGYHQVVATHTIRHMIYGHSSLVSLKQITVKLAQQGV